MRYALRNPGKITENFGSDFYQLLKDSLKAYSGDIGAHKITLGKDIYSIIGVPHLLDNGTIFQFLVISRIHDVYTVAYYSKV